MGSLAAELPLITVYYTDKPGGFCKRLYRLSNALAASGRSITFYSLDPELLALNNSVERRRIPFLMKRRSGLWFWLIFSLWTPLFLLFELRGRERRAFVFHPFYWVLLLPCRVVHGLKMTTFFRSVGSRTYWYRRSWLRAAVSRMLESLCFRFSDRVVVQNVTMARRLARGALERELYLLPNDLPARTHKVSTFSGTEPLRCLTVGMFDGAKNISLLLEAFRELPPDAYRLTIVGDGPALPALRAEAAQDDRLRPVEFVGWQPDPSPHYQEAHLLLHPSLNEGMPNAVLEALSYGLAVFGADTEELRELLGDELLLFDPYDCRSLRERLRSYRSDPAFREHCHRALEARKTALRFDWENSACEILRDKTSLIYIKESFH